MSNHDHRLSRRDAEEILASPAQSDRAVGPVLDALAAPGRESELLREDATVAAFHAARLSPAPTPRSDTTMSKPTRTAAKAFVATGAVVALTSGGLALAATGHLPTLPDQASDRATEAVAKHTTKSPTETPTSPAEASTTETSTETESESETATESPETEAAPTPNLEGLCNAFQNGNRTEKGKSLDSAAFTALATAAGGKDSIATYCVSLIGEPKPEKVKPVKPEKTKPAHPVKPAPTKPAPSKPAKPATPVKPTKSSLPHTASNPTKPVKPAQGGKPEGVSKR